MQFFQKLYNEAPDYEIAIRVERTYATCGSYCETAVGVIQTSEEFFGGLGAWAEKQKKELGVS